MDTCLHDYLTGPPTLLPTPVTDGGGVGFSLVVVNANQGNRVYPYIKEEAGVFDDAYEI